MNREIKFRVWDKFDNEMYKVESINYDCLQEIVTITVYINDSVCLSYNKEHSTDKGRTSALEIMQYTGLKDKNGVEIYEGDIVKCKLIDVIKENKKWVNKITYENYIVVYSKEDLGFRFEDDKEKEKWKLEDCELEVMGNIYENKDLLKVEDNEICDK